MPDWFVEFTQACTSAGENIAAGLDVARRFGHLLSQPGQGRTIERWAGLALAGACDLTVARILEAHSDALAILAEHGEPTVTGTWGVFAAEGPQPPLTAEGGAHGWTLNGTKPWCSLASVLDHALVSAHTSSGRRLFEVDLDLDSVTAEPPAVWVARGLRAVTSGPVHFAGTPARPVGEPGWYLQRAGFAWGAMGVAACWYGGARALANGLLVAARRKPSDDVLALHLGVVDAALYAAACSLRDAAARVDAGTASGPAGELLALRARSIVADAAEVTLRHVGHALGPAPLAFDELHARRVADLELYIRQHHGERDLAALGSMLA
jgi:alkylation response protein AidB-like acyl-CoA dehydrogenase